MTKIKKNTYDFEHLLDLDGEVFPMDNGYWVKFEVQVVEESVHRPHGIKYAMSLHDRYNTRVLGYDNAHAVKPARKGYGGKIRTWDHKHEREHVRAYTFQGPGQLLEDFWDDVNELLDDL